MLGNNFGGGGGGGGYGFAFGGQQEQDDAYLGRPISPPLTGASTSASANPRFCDTDNLQAATDYLNSQLSLSAFPTSSFTPSNPLVFLNANPHQAADLINLVFSLLQHRQRDAALRDDVDTRMVRLENDYEAMAANLQRHKDKIALDERELRAQLARYSKLETAHREVGDKLKNTVDELKMVKAALVQAKNQFTHDKRKSERELSQLKLKFQKLASDRFKDLKLNYKIANPGPYPASRTHAGPRRAAHPEDDYHSALLRDVEAREHALLGELDALKRLLHEVWIELQHLHSLAVPDLQVVDLPFELVRETVAHRVREAMCAVRDEWAAVQEEARGAHELEQARRVVEVQQEEMVQTSEQIEGFKRQVEELQRQMWETGQRMERGMGASSSGGGGGVGSGAGGRDRDRDREEQRYEVQQYERERYERQKQQDEYEQQQQQQQQEYEQQQQYEEQNQQYDDGQQEYQQHHLSAPAPTASVPTHITSTSTPSVPPSATNAFAARFAGRPLSLMSDTGDTARTGLRAQFEQVHAERARLAEEALHVGMERQRLEREKEIVKARAAAAGAGGSSGVRSSQLGRVVEYANDDGQGQAQGGMDVDMDVDAEGLIHELDAAMHQQQNQHQRNYFATPARPTSSSTHTSAYPPPETPQSRHLNPYPSSSTLSGADSSNIRAPTSDLFGMGDVSRIPAGTTTSTAHATPTAATASTASNVWTTPLSAMQAGSVVMGHTPQSPEMAPPSQAQAQQAYLKPALRTEQHQHMTPAGQVAGTGRQVKISPQSVAYFASSTGSASGSTHRQAQQQQQQQQQRQAAAVQVPTVLGSSTSTNMSQQQQHQRGGYFVDENQYGSRGGGAAAAAGRVDNPFGVVRSGSSASTASGRYR